MGKSLSDMTLGLWKQFEHDRDGYTQAKTDFVQRYTQKPRVFPPLALTSGKNVIKCNS